MRISLIDIFQQANIRQKYVKMHKLPQNYAIMLQIDINIRTICTAHTLKPIKSHTDRKFRQAVNKQAVSFTISHTTKETAKKAKKS